MNLYEHQKETVDFLSTRPRAFITSTPGTGKTVSILESWHQQHEGKMLVIAPKSTLEAVWGNDIKHFYPRTKYGVFRRKYAKHPNYVRALLLDNDICIFNIEAVDLILENKDIIETQYSVIVIDEFTSIKNRSAQRSKKAARLAACFSHRYLLSGTPTPNGLLDIWHPAFVCDDGTRLGSNFFHFRNSVCQPIQRGYAQVFTEWEELEGASDVVADTLRDITIRHVLEEVVDMPDRIYRTMEVTMPDKLRKHYNEMLKTSILQLKQDDVVALNKAVLGNKLLQIASGSVYGSHLERSVAKSVLLDKDKYDLVTELVKERDHSLVFYLWQHQADELAKQFSKEGITFDIISGKVSDKDRARIIQDFQDSKLQTLLMQPAAAAHGITLTKSTASIWCSPTWNLEHFIQANHRDYRIGQKCKTEVIMIQYTDTIEQKVYSALQHKKDALDNLLEILQS
jgi:SNF2 family DNA or RNA helicase